MKTIAVYDNTVRPNEVIRDVIGDKGFGETVVKRKKLGEYYQESLRTMFSDIAFEWLNTVYDMEQLAKKLLKSGGADGTYILHCFSDYTIASAEEVSLTYRKLPYIKEDIFVCVAGKPAAIMFCHIDQYEDFLKKAAECGSSKKAAREYRFAKLETKGLECIGETLAFIQCITGNFDSRYFNSLHGTAYEIRKTSDNIKKIKSEYTYYHLLPEKMQHWFVMPYDYREEDSTASYAMERLHMTDVAIQWVHGSIQAEEFMELLDMYFYFFQQRSCKTVSFQQYCTVNEQLYVQKVEKRIQELKMLPAYQKIEALLAVNSRLHSIDSIFAWYLKLKKEIEGRIKYPLKSVIGHGDACFANALYNHATRTLKFIDPKGALEKEDLWTDPYYDIAKLSHSICGRYDFFNNGMFDIEISHSFDYVLNIPFQNEQYKRIFQKKAEDNGFDYWSVRLYEASLFLSMLPLHMDDPHKVFGFILNAAEILGEIEEHV